MVPGCDVYCLLLHSVHTVHDKTAISAGCLRHPRLAIILPFQRLQQHTTDTCVQFCPLQPPGRSCCWQLLLKTNAAVRVIIAYVAATAYLHRLITLHFCMRILLHVDQSGQQHSTSKHLTPASSRHHIGPLRREALLPAIRQPTHPPQHSAGADPSC